jgi:hypothetical protein
MGHRTAFAVAIYAFGMAMLFAVAAYFLPPGNDLIPVSLSFTTIGLLGSAAARTLRRHEDRIAALERQLTMGRDVA